MQQCCMSDGASIRDSKLTRRVVSVGGVLLGGLVVAPLALVALPFMALFDLVSGRPRLPTPRAALFGLWYLAWEWVAVFVGLALWIGTGFGLGMRTRTVQEWHRSL